MVGRRAGGRCRSRGGAALTGVRVVCACDGGRGRARPLAQGMAWALFLYCDREVRGWGFRTSGTWGLGLLGGTII